MSAELFTCPLCKQKNELKLCTECYCCVCGEELQCGYCVSCEEQQEIENERLDNE